MRGRWGPVVAVIGLVLGASQAMAQGAPPPDSLMTPAVIEAGRVIFHGRGTCHACHGDKLQGGPIAPALTGPEWRHIDGSYKTIRDRIDNGFAGTVMMPHPGRITEAQVFMVASYVWAVSHGRAQP